MDMENLVHMANRIGVFFESMPVHEEAVRGVEEHIRKFWPPLMREKLVQAASGEERAHLHPLVLQAVARYTDALVKPGSP